MKSQSQSFLKIDDCYLAVKSEVGVKPQVEVSVKSFTCHISVATPSLGCRLFTVVRNDYFKIWGPRSHGGTPVENCSVFLPDFSPL